MVRPFVALITKPLLCAALLYCGSAWAIQVTYTVEGDFDLVLGSDLYSLDGAHFDWSVTVETQADPTAIRFAGTYGTSAEYGIDAWVSSTFVVTGRPAQQTDILEILQPNTVNPLQVNNFPSFDYDPDTLIIRFEGFAGELAGLVYGSTGSPERVAPGAWQIEFSQDEFDGAGPVSLPDSFNSEPTSIEIDGPWRNSQRTVFYTIDNNLSFSSSVVPIPAAVWLFGSALGLMGWMRRRVST